jgi:hypothetical protein
MSLSRGLPILLAGVALGCTNPITTASSPRLIENLEVGSSFQLSAAFGDDWTYAFAADCWFDKLRIGDLDVSMKQFPCTDPEVQPMSVALIDADGRVTRIYKNLEGAWRVGGCYSPDAKWTKTPSGLLRDSTGVGDVPCEQPKDP